MISNVIFPGHSEEMADSMFVLGLRTWGQLAIPGDKESD